MCVCVCIYVFIKVLMIWFVLECLDELITHLIELI